MELKKSNIAIGIGIIWAIQDLYFNHKLSWLVPAVFIVIGIYLKSKE